MIEGIYTFISEKYYRLSNNYEINNHTALYANYYPIKGLSPYGLNKPDNYFEVGSFQQIGWPDPFKEKIATYRKKYEEP